MKKTFLFSALFLIATSIFSQTKAYVIYTAKGKKVSYEKMLKKLKGQDIILFGEEHNNPIAHWLEYEVTVSLNNSRQLILGAEMIEADNQDELNDYLAGNIDYEAFDSLARLWPNYKTDYAPLVDFAKDNGLDFVATNIPRRFAHRVFERGFETLDSLSMEEKAWVAPLPIAFDSELPTYKSILEMLGEHGTPELVMAQATKDATMAHFTLKNYEPGHLFIHYNGSFHSDYYEGILWYMKREQPELNYMTISTVTQDNVNKLEKDNLNKADFIICVDANMTTTY